MRLMDLEEMFQQHIRSVKLQNCQITYKLLLYNKTGLGAESFGVLFYYIEI